jgi:hypothetical protein
MCKIHISKSMISVINKLVKNIVFNSYVIIIVALQNKSSVPTILSKHAMQHNYVIDVRKSASQKQKLITLQLLS